MAVSGPCFSLFTIHETAVILDTTTYQRHTDIHGDINITYVIYVPNVTIYHIAFLLVNPSC